MSGRKLCPILAAVLLLAAPVQALDPNKRLTQYMHTSWRIQDGSAPSGMWSIGQTTDGFLWFSSGSGDLYRFDGVRFVPWLLPVKNGPEHSVANVFGDNTGALWVLGRNEIVRARDGVASGFRMHGLGVLQSFSQAPDGSLWVLNNALDDPLCQIAYQTLQCFGKPDEIPIAPIDSLLSDGRGGGHYGLPGMRERTALIGSTLAVWSKVDEGTEVELCVPGAYAKPQRRWWFPRSSKA